MADDGGFADAALEVLHRQHQRLVTVGAVGQGAEQRAHPVDVGQLVSGAAAGFGVFVRGGQAAIVLGVADGLFAAAHHLGGAAHGEPQVQLFLGAGGIDAVAQPADHGVGAAGEVF